MEATDEGGNRAAGGNATAVARLVNAIPWLRAAPPGLYDGCPDVPDRQPGGNDAAAGRGADLNLSRDLTEPPTDAEFVWDPRLRSRGRALICLGRARSGRTGPASLFAFGRDRPPTHLLRARPAARRSSALAELDPRERGTHRRAWPTPPRYGPTGADGARRQPGTATTSVSGSALTTVAADPVAAGPIHRRRPRRPRPGPTSCRWLTKCEPDDQDHGRSRRDRASAPTGDPPALRDEPAERSTPSADRRRAGAVRRPAVDRGATRHDRCRRVRHRRGRRAGPPRRLPRPGSPRARVLGVDGRGTRLSKPAGGSTAGAATSRASRTADAVGTDDRLAGRADIEVVDERGPRVPRRGARARTRRRATAPRRRRSRRALDVDPQGSAHVGQAVADPRLRRPQRDAVDLADLSGRPAAERGQDHGPTLATVRAAPSAVLHLAHILGADREVVGAGLVEQAAVSTSRPAPSAGPLARLASMARLRVMVSSHPAAEPRPGSNASAWRHARTTPPGRCPRPSRVAEDAEREPEDAALVATHQDRGRGSRSLPANPAMSASSLGSATRVVYGSGDARDWHPSRCAVRMTGDEPCSPGRVPCERSCPYITLCPDPRRLRVDGDSDDDSDDAGVLDHARRPPAPAGPPRRGSGGGLTGKTKCTARARLPTAARSTSRWTTPTSSRRSSRPAPGAKFKVELENEGELPHTFTVDALDIDKRGRRPARRRRSR